MSLMTRDNAVRRKLHGDVCYLICMNLNPLFCKCTYAKGILYCTSVQLIGGLLAMRVEV